MTKSASVGRQTHTKSQKYGISPSYSGVRLPDRRFVRTPVYVRPKTKKVILVFQLVILLLSFLLFLLTVFNTYPVQSGHFKKMTSKFRSYYGMFGVYLGFTILLNALKLSYRRDNPDNWAAIYTEDTFFDFVYCVQRTLTPIYYYSFIR